MDLMGLPCQRGRHPSCTGTFHVGVAKLTRRYGCLCACHEAENDRRSAEYARLLSQRRIQLLPS